MPESPPSQMAITEFRFRVCSRCGQPPSDGPCIMGNEEHAETWEKPYAAFSVVRDLAVRLEEAEAERDRLKSDQRSIGQITQDEADSIDGAEAAYVAHDEALKRIAEALLPVLQAVAHGDDPEAAAHAAASIALRNAGGTETWQDALIESHDAHMFNWKQERARVVVLEAALCRVERMHCRLHPVAGYMFDTDPRKVAREALGESDPQGSASDG